MIGTERERVCGGVLSFPEVDACPKESISEGGKECEQRDGGVLCFFFSAFVYQSKRTVFIFGWLGKKAVTWSPSVNNH